MAAKVTEVFRKNVSMILEDRGMTITELAERIGTSRPGMSRILSGIDGVTLERADRIAKALDYSLSEILEEKLKIHAHTN